MAVVEERLNNRHGWEVYEASGHPVVKLASPDEQVAIQVKATHLFAVVTTTHRVLPGGSGVRCDEEGIGERLNEYAVPFAAAERKLYARAILTRPETDDSRSSSSGTITDAQTGERVATTRSTS